MNIPSLNPLRTPFPAAPQGGAPEAQKAVTETPPVDPATVDRLELSTAPDRGVPIAGVVDKVKQATVPEPLAKQPVTTSGPTLELSAEEKEKRARDREEVMKRALSTLPKPFQDQEAAMEKVLAEGKGTFINTAGAAHEVTIARDGDKPLYEVKNGGKSFEVTLAKDLDAKSHMARLLDFYTKAPEHLLDCLKSVRLETAVNPTDEYWAKVYGRDTFTSAASAGGGAITFWGLKDRPDNLKEDTFNHELGHLIGAQLSTSRKEHATMIPPGWEEAAKADGNRVSDYAGENPDEDFAESWAEFIAVQKAPEKLKAFQEKYPNRSKILEVIHQRRENGGEVKKDLQRMLKIEENRDA